MKTLLVILGVLFIIAVVMHFDQQQKKDLVQKNQKANPEIDWTAARIAQLEQLSKRELQDALDGKLNIQLA